MKQQSNYKVWKRPNGSHAKRVGTHWHYNQRVNSCTWNTVCFNILKFYFWCMLNYIHNFCFLFSPGRSILSTLQQIKSGELPRTTTVWPLGLTFPFSPEAVTTFQSLACCSNCRPPLAAAVWECSSTLYALLHWASFRNIYICLPHLRASVPHWIIAYICFYIAWTWSTTPVQKQLLWELVISIINAFWLL